MARFGTGASVAKIVFLIILIFVLIIGGLLWVDFLGLINVGDSLNPILKVVHLDKPEESSQINDTFLLEKERLAKEKEALSLQEVNLSERSIQIKEKEEELTNLALELEAQKKKLDEKEKSLNQALKMYDNKRANLEQNAIYLEGMPPEKAVGILIEMDDNSLVDLLRTSERLSQERQKASLVAYWLSLMPPQRAAEVQSKMAIKPEQ